MKKLLSSLWRSNHAWSITGQALFLGCNFLTFVLLVKALPTHEFGAWAIYMTVIAIVDSMRQGLLQNGLTRELIQSPGQRGSLISSALCINLFIILLAAVGMLVWGLMNNHNLLTSALFQNAYKSLLSLGLVQFINILYFSRQDFKGYASSQFAYAIVFISGLVILVANNQMTPLAILDLQLMAVILPVMLALYTEFRRIELPRKAQINSLLQFGKYTAGTNLLSMLFHKADILMLAWFTNSSAVALFHFATKIVGYAELPLNALSQVIYPKLAAAHTVKGTQAVRHTYFKSVITLLCFIVPITIITLLFKDQIINLLGSHEYSNTSLLITCLMLACLVKPLGRVFGLTLDAIGQPQVNFQMLMISLVINVSMNLILIPVYGVMGAAIATSSSILITVSIGQLHLRKILNIHFKDLKAACLAHFSRSF